MKYRKFTSVKSYNKWRKQFLLGTDVNGKKLYPGDFVKIHMPVEVSKPHCSMIYWSALDGAYIEAHPVHKWMDKLTIDEPRHRDLAKILRDQESYNTEGLLHVRPYIEKISYTDYKKWYDETKARYTEMQYWQTQVDYLIENIKDDEKGK